jgi:hypothetical protein
MERNDRQHSREQERLQRRLSSDRYGRRDQEHDFARRRSRQQRDEDQQHTRRPRPSRSASPPIDSSGFRRPRDERPTSRYATSRSVASVNLDDSRGYESPPAPWTTAEDEQPWATMYQHSVDEVARSVHSNQTPDANQALRSRSPPVMRRASPPDDLPSAAADDTRQQRRRAVNRAFASRRRARLQAAQTELASDRHIIPDITGIAPEVEESNFPLILAFDDLLVPDLSHMNESSLMMEQVTSASVKKKTDLILKHCLFFSS